MKLLLFMKYFCRVAMALCAVMFGYGIIAGFHVSVLTFLINTVAFFFNSITFSRLAETKKEVGKVKIELKPL